ncbi:MAG TPA: hypothetical protein PLD25_10770 [Chloroflexota bacterium]|nr:hypothetical protein [Chloroflexota bacterium]
MSDLPKQNACPWCGALAPFGGQPVELPDCFQANRVSVRELRESGLPIAETTYLALGGGLGSFAWVDYLRVCGTAVHDIAVVGYEPVPYGRFQRLCRDSQISDEQRIRSDSGARPDNLWGWPGYAVQEMVGLLRRGKWAEAGRIAWQIFSETALADNYAPRARMVYAALEREMKRIGWQHMFHQGEICAIRQTDDGRYVVVVVPVGEGNGRVPQCFIAPYLHLALGHLAIQLAPEVQAYRQNSGDCHLLVQAYEKHEHIYHRLAQRGGIVVLRGRGIVASRILQRLDEIRRATGRNIQVIHLLRHSLTSDTTYDRARRLTRHHWQWQPYNFPKAAFGGDLRLVLEETAPETRPELLATWGGSTTSDRQDWRELVARGRRQGWYRLIFGEVGCVRANGRDRLILHLQEESPLPQESRLVADFMIDCTGLDDRLDIHPLLADLCARYGLRQNNSGRLEVTPDFELKQLRNGYGQVFLAGTMAFGNAYAPVDSFMGLQYAAQRSVDVLIRENAPGLRPLRGWESARQWWRWWQGVEP